MINPRALVIAAIGEGLSPCGLLVLAFLLVFLMASESRKTILSFGFAYITAFFMARLLSGFALFSFIQLPGLYFAFSLIAAIMIFIVGIIQIKEGLPKKEEPPQSTQASEKGIIPLYMKRAAIPAGLILGALAGVYGMACTVEIYMTIVRMIGTDPAIGLMYLILYNYLAITPLLVIITLVYFCIPPERINSWREERKKVLRTMVGLIIMLMAISIIILLL